MQRRSRTNCQSRSLIWPVRRAVWSSCPVIWTALAENLWMAIKGECIRGRLFATSAEANLALFEYIDGFYNPRRIQKRLATSARSNTTRSTTPTRQRPNK